MNEIIDWRSWVESHCGTAERPVIERALGALIANDKVTAVWLSGSRVTGQADEHSDTDVRIHAPGWSDADQLAWLHATDPGRRPLVRFSKLGPTMLNYECVFAPEVAVDLLVFAADSPMLSFDSVVLKSREPLPRQPALQLVRETPVNPAELRNQVDGVIIDQKKFGKLLARGERLAAGFLLDAQRFAVLRLAYVATRGLDCGARQMHTLASLRLVRQVLLAEAPAGIRAGVVGLTAEGTVEENVAALAALIEPVFVELRRRFPAAGLA